MKTKRRIAQSTVLITLPNDCWQILRETYPCDDYAVDLRKTYLATAIALCATVDAASLKRLAGYSSIDGIPPELAHAHTTARVYPGEQIAAEAGGALSSWASAYLATIIRRAHRDQLCQQVMCYTASGAISRNRALFEVSCADPAGTDYETLRKYYHRRYLQEEGRTLRWADLNGIRK